MKTVGGFRRTRYRGLDRTGLAGHLVAYNLFNKLHVRDFWNRHPAVPEV